MSLFGALPPIGVTLLPQITAHLKSIGDRIKDGTATKDDLNDFMIFSPFTLKEDIDQELVIFGAAAVGAYLSKTDRGMKLLDTMVKQYFGTISNIVSSMARGGSTHLFSSLTAQMITVKMMRRLGLVTNAEANQIHGQLQWTINKIIAEDLVADITHAVGQVFGGAGKVLLAGP